LSIGNITSRPLMLIWPKVIKRKMKIGIIESLKMSGLMNDFCFGRDVTHLQKSLIIMLFAHFSSENRWSTRYCLIDKYIAQPPTLSSGLRISRRLSFRVWTLRKVKYIKLILSLWFAP
jgi:hypothetical protein